MGYVQNRIYGLMWTVVIHFNDGTVETIEKVTDLDWTNNVLVLRRYLGVATFKHLGSYPLFGIRKWNRD